MAWRLAKSLEKLRAQVNQKWPARSRNSDGSIGDAKHASRASDHNPWVKDGAMNIVTAIDITHDPKSGCDSYALAECWRRSRDPRIKYIISNGRIASQDKGWTWRKYTGSNPHNHHVHISVMAAKKFYDDVAEWPLEIGAMPEAAKSPPEYKAPLPTLRLGATGAHVATLQKALGLIVDGDFGKKTKAAVIAFQKARGMSGDGVVGPQTWGAINAPR